MCFAGTIGAAPHRGRQARGVRLSQPVTLWACIIEWQCESVTVAIGPLRRLRLIVTAGAASIAGTHPGQVDVLTAEHHERDDPEAEEMSQDQHSECDGFTGHICKGIRSEDGCQVLLMPTFGA